MISMELKLQVVIVIIFVLQAPIYSLCFSVEGRFLVSAGADCRVLIWDLAHGHLLAELTGHTAPIHTLAFSRDGNILTSGTLIFKCL